MKKQQPAYSFLSVEIIHYEARVDASINYEVRDKRHHHHNPNIYSFGSHLEIEGRCLYPEEQKDETARISIIGSERKADEFTLKLEDCHVRDESGHKIYKKVRGKEIAEYDIPKGVGYLQKDRGSKSWSGASWVPPQTVSGMLTILPHIKPLYLEIHLYHEGKNYWVAGLTLQTENSLRN